MYFAFDFDGTIANSELLKMEAYIDAIADVSGCVPIITPDEMALFIGLPEAEIVGLLLEKLGEEKTKTIMKQIVVRKRDMYDGVVETLGVSLFESVANLTEELVAKGGRCAIVTGSPSYQVEKIINANGRSLSTFEFIIGKEHVARSKPSPEGYEIFLKRFGIGREQACAVEDSPQGAKAALSAGIHTLMPIRNYNVAFEASNTTKCLSEKALREAALQHLSSNPAILKN